MGDIICPWNGCHEDDFESEKDMKIHHKLAHGESIAKLTSECNVCGAEFQYYESARTGALCDECSDYDSDTWSEYMSEVALDRSDKWSEPEIVDSPEVRDENKRKIRQLKYELGCSRCGYDEYHGSLSFHHEEQKDDDIWRLAKQGYRWEIISEEIEKCRLLCLNCHMLEHGT